MSVLASASQVALTSMSGLGILFYLFLTRKVREVIFAASLTTPFIVISGYYTYTTDFDNQLIFRMFPVLCWIAGLLLARIVYQKVDSFWLTTILYWLILLVTEYIGYNLLGIRLQSNYEGLFGLEVVHLPLVGQLFYLFAGPAYLLLLNCFSANVKKDF